MILDRLTNHARYQALHPGFPQALEFLCRSDLNTLAAGRYEIDGARLYANVDRVEGRGLQGARLEAHRRYIDIQFTLEGTEIIGWRERGSCTGDGAGFNGEKDIEFFSDGPDAWIPVPPGTFAVFFPNDAHAPLAGQGGIVKVVVKVAVDWKLK